MTSLASFLGRPVTLPEYRPPDGTYRVRAGDRWSDPIPPGTTQEEIDLMAEGMARTHAGRPIPSWEAVRAAAMRGAK